MWIFPFPRLHNSALSPDRVCPARGRTNSVSSRSGTGRGLASGWHDVQTPPSGFAACGALLSPVSPNQCWTGFELRPLPCGKHRLFRSTFSWKDRSSCKFFGDRVPRGVSWKQHSTFWSDVLARDSDVALQRHGMASSVRAAVEVSIYHARHRWQPAASLFNPPTQRKSSSGSHYRRTGRAGCLRSTTRSKRLLAQCSHAAIISSSVQPIRKTRRYEVVSSESRGTRSQRGNERNRSRCRHRSVRRCATWHTLDGAKS